jgi:hypothetical protein
MPCGIGSGAFVRHCVRVLPKCFGFLVLGVFADSIKVLQRPRRIESIINRE